MIETAHLRIVDALQRQGTLTAAADALCLSQSALSHQIRYLEKRLGIQVWEKVGRRLRLTRAGEELRRTAERILPLLEQTERRLAAYADGRQGMLRIGVECYPCYEWLTGIIAGYLEAAPLVEVDIVHQFQFTGIEGLMNRHIDMLVTPDLSDQPGVGFETLFDYELVLVTGEAHPLAARDRVAPADLEGEVLISFPVAESRLDILTLFLWPGGVRPARHKQIESIDIMLQLVASHRGVCALPRWLAEQYRTRLPLRLLRLGEAGVHRHLYAAMRQEDREVAYVRQFLDLARES